MPPGITPDRPGRIRVFIVDDHELVREGLRTRLGQEDDLEVAGEAGSAADALAMIPEAGPDVVILDQRLPDRLGIEVCRELRSSGRDVRILMLSAYGDEDALSDAIVAGADGYVPKDAPSQELVDAIRTVARGEALLPPEATRRAAERIRWMAEQRPSLDRLSDRERRILDLIAEGLTNREIGERMSLAEKTVRNYVSGLLDKMGFRHRTEAALYASKLPRAEPPR